jgi:hypothetical protein
MVEGRALGVGVVVTRALEGVPTGVLEAELDLRAARGVLSTEALRVEALALGVLLVPLP